jgi:predicted transcriptional regulator
MKILLSIKPRFVEKIISGEKLYEYRKVVFKRTDLDTIVVYSSGHVKKIVGEIKFKRIICDTPQNIWASTGADSGLTEEEFRDYFKNKRVAYAIKIDSFIPFKSSKTIQEKYPGVKAPQSFVYLK